MSVLLVEHDMGFVMNLADRVIVLDFGTKIAEGAPDAIKRNPEVIKAYLGAVA
jgi:ABC-type branched-subunit amino acid transport system ATPase component